MVLLNANKNLEKPKASMGVWEYGSVDNIFYLIICSLVVLCNPLFMHVSGDTKKFIPILPYSHTLTLRSFDFK